MPRYGTWLIKEMQFADVDSVCELEKRIFASPWSADLFRYEVRNCERTIYLVAVEDAHIVGYVGAQLFDKEVHVTNMAVEPESRRGGLGTALILECIREGLERGARWLTLEVRRGNEEARLFYLEFGFEELGLRHGYYTDTGEDAIIMATGDIRTQEYTDLLARMHMRLLSKEGG
ncbi:MAG: ribosomal protein S18-alanine N-acetyltransferase [Candidatus Geothermincolia bacterium]